MKRGDPGAAQGFLARKRNRIRKGPFELHQLRPPEAEALGINAFSPHALGAIDDFGRPHQNLFRIASAQRARSTERKRVDNGDAPSGLAALKSRSRGRSTRADYNQIESPIHEFLHFWTVGQLESSHVGHQAMACFEKQRPKNKRAKLGLRTHGRREDQACSIGTSRKRPTRARHESSHGDK